MTITARVIRLESRDLFVRDISTGQEVFVHANMARQFNPGDIVRITSNGTITMNIPKQITAQSITLVQASEPSRPSQQDPQQKEIQRARVLQVGQNMLTVLNLANCLQYVVNYQYAHHFFCNQLVHILTNSITSTMPPKITATDIYPIP